MNSQSLLLFFSFSLLIASCSQIPRISTTLVKHPNSDETILIADSKKIDLSTGYSILISKGTKLKYVGYIPQGKVYKPINFVLMIEGTHMYQAYLVLQNQILTGFYLPASKEFSDSLSSHQKLLFIQE